MRLPNGYGTVYKLSGDRRKPWIAKVPNGKVYDKEKGKARQIYLIVGYYEDRKTALTALAKYNDNPYDLSNTGMTFERVYELWSEEHFKKIVPSAVRTWKSAYNHSKPLHQMIMKEIRANHLESTIKGAVVGDTTKARMKSLYNLIYKFAMKHEFVDKDYARLCDAVKKSSSSKEKIPFSSEEIELLWNNLDIPFVDMILIDIYSGWRPQELSILKTDDIDLENRTMFGGIKTDAGRNRYVPIHSKVYDLVKKRYEENKETLFVDEDGNKMTYDKYRGRWKKVMDRLKLVHSPHEARHTFITLSKSANVDEYILKLIVGHAIRDITEKVYTHRTMEQLKNEIEKIK